jgi:hypothetical protein
MSLGCNWGAALPLSSQAIRFIFAGCCARAASGHAAAALPTRPMNSRRLMLGPPDDDTLSAQTTSR